MIIMAMISTLGVISFFHVILAKSPQRVIFGEHGNIGEFPYHVSIRQISKRGQYIHICGGAIISPKHVLSAAHCFVNLPGVTNYTKDLIIVSGTNANVPGAGNINRIKFATHPSDYSGILKDSWRSDIAIFTLVEEMHFDNFQNLIKLAKQECKANDTAVTGGWGDLSYPRGMPANNIMKATMKIVDHQECQAVIETKILDSQLCAIAKNGTGLCVGDSGGPLVMGDTLIGIASWVIPCARNVPDIFNSVYYYLDWIKKILNANETIPE